jgi:hypothetical protein
MHRPSRPISRAALAIGFALVLVSPTARGQALDAPASDAPPDDARPVDTAPPPDAGDAVDAPQTDADMDAARSPPGGRVDAWRRTPGDAEPSLERRASRGRRAAAITLPGLDAPQGNNSSADEFAAGGAQTPPLSADAMRISDWVTISGDNGGLPFVIVDKVDAAIFVYGPDGRLQGAAPALVGLEPGDDSVSGVGDLKLSQVSPDMRTTPAGRFLAGFGPASGGRTVLWVDYADSISLHPVVTNNPREHRLERIQSSAPEDHRITYGCINVPATFYDDVVMKAFAGGAGVVYILPDTRPLEEVFPDLRSAGAATTDASARVPMSARRRPRVIADGGIGDAGISDAGISDARITGGRGSKRTSSSNARGAPVMAERGKDGRARDVGPGEDRPAQECAQSGAAVAGGSGDAYPYEPSGATCERDAAGRGI